MREGLSYESVVNNAVSTEEKPVVYGNCPGNVICFELFKAIFSQYEKEILMLWMMGERQNHFCARVIKQ